MSKKLMILTTLPYFVAKYLHVKRSQSDLGSPKVEPPLDQWLPLLG